MKKKIQRSIHPLGFVFSILLLMSVGCKKHDIDFPLRHYDQVNLVSDVSGFNAARLDPNLVNAWGIAVAPSGPIWISANHTGVSTIYDKLGATLIPPVTIPGHAHMMGAPTGVVFNSTTWFVIPENNMPAKFIFAGEDGTISAWNGGSSAIVVADRSAENAVYKGLAMGWDDGKVFLFATNFKQSKIDVFDQWFHYVAGVHFKDPNIPADFGPFNIRNIDGKLFVTYAKHKAPDNMDDEKGPGNGYINIFNTDGKWLKRFASKGTLNSPWGMVVPNAGFCDVEHSLLVGNFGDGHINVFDFMGNFEGQLQSNGKPVAIDGLWALENNVPGADPKQVFFTAGPDEESHGLFGYLIRK